MGRQRNIHVYIDWAEKSSPIYMGILHTEVIRGKEVFSFESSDEWLKHPEFKFIDPDLGQFKGHQYLNDSKDNFGLFLDSSPDRWGRLLIRRREAMKLPRMMTTKAVQNTILEKKTSLFSLRSNTT